MEVPVKRLLAGADPKQVLSRGAMANPESLEAYAALVADR
jgi:hypothetical protein